MDPKKYSTAGVYLAMRKLGYSIKGRPFELNIVGIRAETSVSDSFDDVLMVTRVNRNHILETVATPCTTDPGKHWLFNPMNVKGTAIMVPGQYKGVYKIGLHHGEYEALVQCGNIKFVRDNNRDNNLDFKLYRDPDLLAKNLVFGIIGANIHRASKAKKALNVGAYSAACQVVQDPTVYEGKIIPWAKEHVFAGNGSTFDYTLLEEREIINALTR